MKPEQNSPCPCGSGKKYKRCCGAAHGSSPRPAEPASPAAAIPITIESALGYHRAGQLDRAEEIYRSILQASPRNADAQHLLGVLLHQTGKNQAAVDLIEKAIKARPNVPEYYNNCGEAYRALKQFDKAAQRYHRALSLKPDYAEAHNNLAAALVEQGGIEEATRHARRALALHPDYVEAHLNLCNILTYEGKPEEAFAHCNRALALRPDFAEAYDTLGNALARYCKFDEALASFDRSLSLKPNFVKAHWNRSHTLLSLGRLDQAWQEYDWRWKLDDFVATRNRFNFTHPWWEGGDLHGKTILLWGEQGIGDEILFANAIPDVIAAAGHCVIECEPRLVPVFARSFPQAEVVPRANPPHPRTLAADVACQCPVGSLPRWFRDSIARFPGHGGYLTADPLRVAFWKERLDSLGANVKVGICWRSMLKNRYRDVHYTELSQWGPILAVPGVTFVNLQYDHCEEELAAARQQFGVEILAWDDIDLLNDLDEAAALTAALDLVIAPNTSVAAMAGALGVPVWEIALNDIWDSLGTDHVPWFPSMRLFSRSWDTPWETTIADVARELEQPDTPPSGTSDRKPQQAPRIESSLPRISDIPQAIQAAIKLHQAGQLQEAETIYRQVLRLQPDNVDALHLLGLIAHHGGQHEIALDLIGKAIALNPNVALFHNNYGEACRALGRIDEAIAHYEQALAIEPDFPEPHTNLGNVLQDQGHLKEAITHYEQALALKPDFAEAHNNLGSALHEEGKLDEAVASCEKALALNPDYAEAHYNLGNILKDRAQLDEAIAHYEKAISLVPAYPDAYYNLGNAFKELKRLAEAINCFERALAMKPGYQEAHLNIGLAFYEQDNLDQAIAHYARVLALNPRHAEAHLSLGVALKDLGRLNESIAHYQEALAIKPDFEKAYYNLGVALHAQGNPDQAIACQQHALRIRPGYPDAIWSMGLELLSCGDLAQGWERYEARWTRTAASPKRPFPQPGWEGNDLHGKTILLWGEQGIGDEILFANAIPDVIAAAGHCVIECEPRLVPVFARSFPQAEVVPRANPPHPRTLAADVACQCPVGSLPRWFRDSIDRFPGQGGYLVADPLRVAFWKERLDSLGANIKVGICWRSMLKNRYRDVHYTELSQWGPILAVPGVTFVNLQYDHCEEELAAARKQFGVEILAWDDIDLLNDLDEAAALTAALDLVIAPNTSVAAMAGALGVPVWEIALNDIWDSLGTDHVPWFPSMRLFSRSWDTPWESTIAVVARELEQSATDALPSSPPPSSAGIGDEVNTLISHALQTAIQYHQAGQLKEAETLYNEVLRLQPDNADALHLLGALAHQIGKNDIAVSLMEEAIRNKPNVAEFHCNCGDAYFALNNSDLAMQHYLQALALNPNLANAHNKLGIVFATGSDFSQAIHHFERAIAIQPGYFEAINNLGNAYMALGKIDEAVTHFTHSLTLAPDLAEAQMNLGNAFKAQGKAGEAIAHYQRALSLEPNVAEVHWNYSQVLLMQGDLGRGWLEYEWRWRWKDFTSPQRGFLHSWWEGNDLHGKTILLWGEQGIGDEILFANAIPDAVSAAGHCVIECEPRLVPLFARSFPQAEVIPRTNPPHPRTLAADVACQCPTGSLPRWFRDSIDRFPGQGGYLVADPLRVAFWKERLDSLGANIKVGICWRSMLKNRYRDVHYTELSQWGPILAVPGVTFVNLQYDHCEEELAAARKQFGVEILAWDDIDLLNNLDEAAALTAALDLVIAPNTSVAAMAGALGVPVWQIALNDIWDSLGTDHVPWFPSMRLFSRSWDTLWETTIAAVARELEQGGTPPPDRKHPPAPRIESSLPRVSDIPQAIQAAIKLHQDGQLQEAETIYRQVLRLQPDHVDALHLLGLIAHHGGQHEIALDLIARAIALNPRSALFHNNYGEACRALGRIDEAVAHYEQALAIAPRYAKAHMNLGSALDDLGSQDDAIAHYEEALAIDPDYADAYVNLGTVLNKQGDNNRAIALYKKALAIDPSLPEAHYNLGNALRDKGSLNEAISHYEAALALQPDSAKTHYNLGMAFKSQRNLDRALSCYKDALRIKPDYADPVLAMGEALLTIGDLLAGWPQYESRWNSTESSPKRPFPQPGWDGGDLHGKTILLWGEQGIGDEILFANAIPDAVSAAGHCVIECEPRLVPVFARSFPQAEVVPRANPPHPRTLAADVACQCPVGSLPRWFRDSIDRFPGQGGYLVADPLRVAFWKERLDSLGANIKVGICWRSMLKNRYRDVHYTELSQWGPILAVPGVTFVNLQYDHCEEELAAARQQFGVEIHDWDDIDLLNDLDEAAALTAALDLVIAPNTSVAAMAGALGVPVWEIALNDIWDSLGTDHVPWFPSMRLFSRSWDTPWETTIADVARELEQTAKAALPSSPPPSSAGIGDEVHALIAHALQTAIQYHQAGQLKEAESLYNEVLRLQPDNADALHLLGAVAHQIGKNEIAVALMEKAIRISPGIASFHNDCGEAYRLQGKLDEAITHYEQALAIDPDFPEPHNNLGNALQDQGRLKDAIAHYEQALALNPDFTQAHNNLGSALHEEGKLDEATASCEKALALDPHYAEAHYNLGNILKDREQLDEAIAHYEKALALHPHYAEAHLNLGVAFKELGRLDEAVAQHEKAIALRPGFAEAYVNLGVALKIQGKSEQAIACQRQALRIRPGYPDATWFLGVALLSCGDLAQGWEKYEARWTRTAASPKRDFPQPGWDGGDLHGKTILLWDEQGIGDEILFANAIPDVIAAAGHCVIECEPRLVPVFARSFPQAEVVPRANPPHPRTLAADVACQCPVGSLPRWFRDSIARFPGHGGYLTADPLRAAFWKERLDSLGANVKVGICWRSMLKNRYRDVHYTELSQWGPILAVPGVTFVNLQYDHCEEELAAARQQFGVEILAWDDIDLLNDLDEAAALTAALDLVIAPNTSVAAMAGALGVPVWEIALNDIWDSLGTDHVPWFPSMRLFSRSWDMPWDSAIKLAALELEKTRPGYSNSIFPRSHQI